MTCCEIWETFDEKHNLIREYTHWKLLIRNRNTTLGNCVAVTKRHMEKLSEIHPEEMAEFALVARDIEHALSAAFQHDKINYQMLMMKDRHTHYHILPRYASARRFAEIEWTDEGWPLLPGAQKENVPQKTLDVIRQTIQQHLPPQRELK